MILSNVKIHEALDKGWLQISPEPMPRTSRVDGPKCPYQTSAVDLRLGEEIVELKRLPVAIDLRAGRFSELADAISRHWEFPLDQPYTLEPNKLVIARTLEQITLPLPGIDSDAPCLAARIEGRSSYSRCGLLVHFTAPTIHAGWGGPLTLEIINFGPHDIQLHKHIYICQLIIEEVQGRPFRNDSQFQGQITAAGATTSPNSK